MQTFESYLQEKHLKKEEIEQIVVADIGLICADSEKIISFEVNGEMALVTWYRKGKQEFNGKYVISVKYK